MNADDLLKLLIDNADLIDAEIDSTEKTIRELLFNGRPDAPDALKNPQIRLCIASIVLTYLDKCADHITYDLLPEEIIEANKFHAQNLADEAISRIKREMEAFDAPDPVLYDEEGNIICTAPHGDA